LIAARDPGETHVTRRRLTEPTHGASNARRARAALLGAALSLLAAGPARAQELRFRQITPDAGLSSSYIQSIFQDRTGFLWFGSDKGLDRYDGYVIHSYRHRRADPHSIADGTIHVLHADRGDTMWVGTNAGLSRYDADQDAFINYAIGGGERAVHGIADDARGGLWIAADDGLYRFDRATASASPLDGSAGSALRGVPILALHADRR
jgi:ligand-binding sensor domain-containing protein